MKSNLYIPQKIKVGFQKRSDTYNGNLAYIIFIDEKGVVRKEGSWESWRDKKIETLELDNTPQSGYVFNKGVERSNYHFGSGRSYIRVHDPRNFEFEISVDNLIGILMNSDVSKRDIVESCVFAWAGKDLILLPTNSEQYKESQEFTKKQFKSISTKDLQKGFTYIRKKSDEALVYIGYYEWYEVQGYNLSRTSKAKGKKHVFYSTATKEFVVISTNTLAECISEEVYSSYANLVEEFENSIHHKPLVGFELKDITSLKVKSYYHYFYKKISEEQMIEVSFYKRDKYQIMNGRTEISVSSYKLKDGIYEQERNNNIGYFSNRNPTIVEEITNTIFNNKKDNIISFKDLEDSIKSIGFKELFHKRIDGVLVHNRD